MYCYLFILISGNSNSLNNSNATIFPLLENNNVDSTSNKGRTFKLLDSWEEINGTIFIRPNCTEERIDNYCLKNGEYNTLENLKNYVIAFKNCKSNDLNCTKLANCDEYQKQACELIKQDDKNKLSEISTYPKNLYIPNQTDYNYLIALVTISLIFIIIYFAYRNYGKIKNYIKKFTSKSEDENIAILELEEIAI
ncbi:hypothetical protein H312_01526 [Anncaliia algerae PRA339]|uniref:Uncharacterized protein n=1 Tax=Anncaliia algerae PRA339 TaxID=1288291 RepID=A0A059F1L7_9MICR|nr:hypothetical protein H312_01526 [Anncaliia algerae PRA339]